MKLHYHPETDCLYIELKDGPGVETREIVEGLVVDLEGRDDRPPRRDRGTVIEPPSSQRLWQPGLAKDRIRRVLARDMNQHREVSSGDRTVPDLATAFALPDEGAAVLAQKLALRRRVDARRQRSSPAGQTKSTSLACTAAPFWRVMVSWVSPSPELTCQCVASS
jgi:uncharacterized protein DUF2283